MNNNSNKKVMNKLNNKNYGYNFHRVYRYEENSIYWDRRWGDGDIDANSFVNMNIYPVKYSELVVNNKEDAILEIGCGLGRLVHHYYNLGFNIQGVEKSKIAIDKINKHNSKIKATEGDALNLPYKDSSFDVALAFGVYHNFENDIEQGIRECSRILKKKGTFCISMRPYNFEMLLNEYYWKYKTSKKQKGKKHFHKLLTKESEFKRLLQDNNLITENIFYGRNVSILYRIPIFKDKKIANSHESIKRSSGYRLNILGRTLDKFLSFFFPYNTSNVLIFIGKKL